MYYNYIPIQFIASPIIKMAPPTGRKKNDIRRPTSININESRI